MLGILPAEAVVNGGDVWRFHPHPEVWLLVGALALSYTYAIKVIGPHAVRRGEAVVRPRQVACFVAGLLILWIASDWPMHDVGEGYLYSAHMLQHMMLSYFMPLAMPEAKTAASEERAAIFVQLSAVVVSGTATFVFFSRMRVAFPVSRRR